MTTATSTLTRKDAPEKAAAAQAGGKSVTAKADKLSTPTKPAAKRG